MIKSYRITKYNPNYRINNVYVKEEWTSISDVGTAYNGKIFTIEEYERVEKNYIDFYIEVLKMLSIKKVKIKELEDPFSLKKWKNNQEIIGYQIGQFIRDCLREKCWGKLNYEKVLFIHFGYDYYTYLGTDLEASMVASIANRYGLYCEKFISPYLETED